ncbi:hypothetical protein KEM52_001911 [Ascosphaera acerosa]|nr:hypothetical protein KEM52_001911 [Ascosphaera acerosa]
MAEEKLSQGISLAGKASETKDPRSRSKDAMKQQDASGHLVHDESGDDNNSDRSTKKRPVSDGPESDTGSSGASSTRKRIHGEDNASDHSAGPAAADTSGSRASPENGANGSMAIPPPPVSSFAADETICAPAFRRASKSGETLAETGGASGTRTVAKMSNPFANAAVASPFAQLAKDASGATASTVSNPFVKPSVAPPAEATTVAQPSTLDTRAAQTSEPTAVRASTAAAIDTTAARQTPSSAAASSSSKTLFGSFAGGFGASAFASATGFAAATSSGPRLSSFASGSNSSSSSEPKLTNYATAAKAASAAAPMSHFAASSQQPGLSSFASKAAPGKGFGTAAPLGGLASGSSRTSTFGSGAPLGTGMGFGSAKALGTTTPFGGDEKARTVTGVTLKANEDEPEKGDGASSAAEAATTASTAKFGEQGDEASTGEEEETTVFSCRAKLFYFANGEWKERGVGALKVNVCPPSDDDDESGKEDEQPNQQHGNEGEDEKAATSKGDRTRETQDKNKRARARIVMRADGVWRVILNTPLFKGMKFGDAAGNPPSTKAVTLTAVEDGHPVLFTLRVHNANLAMDLYKTVQEVIRQL